MAANQREGKVQDKELAERDFEGAWQPDYPRDTTSVQQYCKETNTGFSRKLLLQLYRIPPD